MLARADLRPLVGREQLMYEDFLGKNMDNLDDLFRAVVVICLVWIGTVLCLILDELRKR